MVGQGTGGRRGRALARDLRLGHRRPRGVPDPARAGGACKIAGRRGVVGTGELRAAPAAGRRPARRRSGGLPMSPPVTVTELLTVLAARELAGRRIVFA